MWVLPSGEVILVGNSGFTQKNGTAVAVSGGGNFQSVWASAETDVYAVGDGGAFHWRGDAAWVNQVATGLDYREVFGADATHIWIVGATQIGGSGSILFSSGDGSWTEQTIPATPTLTAVWAASSQVAFAVGQQGAILHLSNGTWTAETAGTTQATFLDVWGSSATDVYAVGYRNDTAAGFVAHSVGDGTWIASDVGMSTTLESVFGGSAKIFLGGATNANDCVLLVGGSTVGWTAVTLAEPCRQGILRGQSLTRTDLTLLQGDGFVSQLSGSSWSQFAAYQPEQGFDTTETAPLNGFDQKCPLDQ